MTRQQRARNQRHLNALLDMIAKINGDQDAPTSDITAKSKMKDCVGRREGDQGCFEGDQRIIQAVFLDRKCKQIALDVTLLAAGFVVGNKGDSVTQIWQKTGASIRSLQQNRVYNDQQLTVRVFKICGQTHSQLLQTLSIIVEAVDLYRRFLSGDYANQVVDTQQVIQGITFEYLPPPITANPFSARTVKFPGKPSEYGQRRLQKLQSQSQSCSQLNSQQNNDDSPKNSICVDEHVKKNEVVEDSQSSLDKLLSLLQSQNSNHSKEQDQNQSLQENNHLVNISSLSSYEEQNDSPIHRQSSQLYDQNYWQYNNEFQHDSQQQYFSTQQQSSSIEGTSYQQSYALDSGNLMNQDISYKYYNDCLNYFYGSDFSQYQYYDSQHQYYGDQQQQQYYYYTVNQSQSYDDQDEYNNATDDEINEEVTQENNDVNNDEDINLDKQQQQCCYYHSQSTTMPPPPENSTPQSQSLLTQYNEGCGYSKPLAYSPPNELMAPTPSPTPRQPSHVPPRDDEQILFVHTTPATPAYFQYPPHLPLPPPSHYPYHGCPTYTPTPTPSYAYPTLNPTSATTPTYTPTPTPTPSYAYPTFNPTSVPTPNHMPMFQGYNDQFTPIPVDTMYNPFSVSACQSTPTEINTPEVGVGVGAPYPTPFAPIILHSSHNQAHNQLHQEDYGTHNEECSDF